LCVCCLLFFACKAESSLLLQMKLYGPSVSALQSICQVGCPSDAAAAITDGRAL
jgi:hypothetical protein